MQYSEEQMREALDLKERVTREIEECEERLEYLKRHLELLDTVLKGSSFTKASSLKAEGTAPRKTGETAAEPAVSATTEPAPDSAVIRRDRDGDEIAIISFTADTITITVKEGLRLHPEIPPFKTFFLDRIIGEMKRKDEQQCVSGQLARGDIIDCEVKLDGSELRQIIIRSYRSRDRLKEIRSSLGWTLSRMLESAK